ncbi:hypothetical protein [Streptomyces djakartensis]|uniref:hypothetical protein n=1 Tax=Streptomyces djakartensis TaxID=68193 RepID=UPI00167C90D0|nr:hypothetical protein [Streptomyces djakartensis]
MKPPRGRPSPSSGRYCRGVLAQVAVALVEAALVRLFLQLSKAFAGSRRPVAAQA